MLQGQGLSSIDGVGPPPDTTGHGPGLPMQPTSPVSPVASAASAAPAASLWMPKAATAAPAVAAVPAMQATPAAPEVPAVAAVAAMAAMAAASGPIMNVSAADRTAGRTAGLAMVRAKKGVILFTHIRRAGGTVLEDYVLKPFVKVRGRVLL